MTAFTNYLEGKVLDEVFAGVAFAAPSSLHVKLHTATPGEDAASAAAGNTARVAVTFTAGANPIVSATAASWTNVSTTETYTHVSIWDAATGGNPLAHGPLASSVAVTAGDNFSIPAGSLTIALD